MTTSTWPKRTSTSLFGNGMTGLQSTCLIQMTNTKESCKQAQKHSTLLSVESRMRRGSLCWKKHTPKPMEIMAPLKVAGQS